MKALSRFPAVLVLLGTLGACGGSGGDAGAGRPNLVLISIDTLRPDHLGCYGYERPTSPRMDAFAAAGARFADVSSVSPWTLPSHATLLTGLYPSRHGVKDHVNKLPDDVESLASRLRREGYHTIGVVNSHNLSDRYGLDQGFESFEYVSEWVDPEDPERRRIVNRGVEINDRGLSWVREGDGRPFFLFLHYYDVHTDFTAEPEFEAMFVGPYEGEIDGTTKQLTRMRAAGETLGADDTRHLLDLYDAEIRQMDVRVGEVLDFLDAEGLAEDTVVVITSDHGEEFMEHGSFLHGRQYWQEVIAVPLLVRGPGVPPGTVVGEPVSLVDVHPTALSLLGLGTDTTDGHDLSTFWERPQDAPRGRFLFAEADHNIRIGEESVSDVMRMVRIDQHKLKFNRYTEETLLFDLARDPLEREDLTAAEEQRAEALLERIEAFLRHEETGEVIEPPDQEELDRLRDLGYLDDRE